MQYNRACIVHIAFTVNGNMNNAGTIILQNGNAGNTLTLAPDSSSASGTSGHYVGSNGLIALNTVLGDSSSSSDRLIISGGSATGSTLLSITNNLGAGAVTSGNGIAVVEAINGGTTSGNAFSSNDDLMAGPYEYFLYRGGLNGSDPDSWFLRSTLTGNAAPNYRQEVSLYTAYPSSQLNYGRAILATFHQRMGAEEQLHLSPDVNSHLKNAWFRVVNRGGNINNDGILKNGPDFDFQIWAVQGGVDLFSREQENGHRDYAGLYGVYGNDRSNVTSYTGASAGQIKFSAASLGAYWTHIGPDNWYLDGVLQGSNYNPSIQSSRMALNAPNSKGYAASLEGGYPLNMKKHVTLQPELQFIYQNTQGFNARDTVSSVAFGSGNAFVSRLGARMIWNDDKRQSGNPLPEKLQNLMLWITPSIWYEANGTTTTSFSSATGMVPFASTLNGPWASMDLGANYRLSKQVYIHATVAPEIYLNGRGKAYSAMAGVHAYL